MRGIEMTVPRQPLRKIQRTAIGFLRAPQLSGAR